MAHDSAGGGGSASSGSSVLCPCKSQKSYSLMIECMSRDCKYKWWHASCAGWSKPKQSILNTMGSWKCPACVMNGFSGVDNLKALEENIVNKLEKMECEIKQEIQSQKSNLSDKI